MYIQRANEKRSCNHCCSGKAISITYCPCVFVVLGIQREMAGAVLSSVTRPALQYSSHKWQDFRKKVTYDKMWVLIFSTTFV